MSRFALIGAFVFLVHSVAVAQDPFGGNGSDPFGNSQGGPGGSDPFGNSAGGSDPFNPDAGGMGIFGGGGGAQAPATTPAAGTADASSEPDSDPVVRLLQADPPQTPDEMAAGLTWMARIRRWDQVGILLDRLAGENWSPQQQAALARAAGPALWIRLGAEQESLNASQQMLINKIQRSPSDLARDPAWIDAWIAKLGSSDPGEVGLAQLRLQDAREAGIARLVNRLLDGQDQQFAPEMVVNTVLRFGDTGRDALRCACTVADADRAARVMTAIAESRSTGFTPELAAGLASKVLSQEQIASLAQAISQVGNLPTEDRIQQFLANEFDNRLVNYFDARARFGNDRDDVGGMAWQLTPDENHLQPMSMPTDMQELAKLSQLAVLRARTRQSDQAIAIENAVAIAQANYQQTSALYPEQLQSKSLAEAVPSSGASAPIEFWQEVFAKANQWQLHGAAIRAIQLAGESPQTPESINFFSDVIADSRPVVRYAALEAIAKRDPVENYRGSEQALQTALEMSKLTDGPLSLVIGLQPDLRQAAVQQVLLATGGEAIAASSAKEALLLLSKNNPVELVFIVDRVNDQTLYELIQRLRAAAKSRAIPIAVLTENLQPHEIRLIEKTPGIVPSLLSKNPEQMQRVVNRLEGELDTAPLGALERSGFAQTASDFLSKVVADPIRYAFYDVGMYRSELADLADMVSGGNRVELLAGLGTGNSQLELVEAITRKSDSAERELAANAFARSIREFGTQMGPAQVSRCYQLYNEFGPKDPTAVKTLGFVLDVIEAQAGKRDWPDAL